MHRLMTHSLLACVVHRVQDHSGKGTGVKRSLTSKQKGRAEMTHCKQGTAAAGVSTAE